jgi:hypothetical protein
MAETTVTTDPAVIDYIDYGAYAAVSGPFTCAGGVFQGLTVTGDPTKIDAFVERVYNATAPHGVRYERIPLCDKLVMLIGNFAKVNATAPKYADFGSVREVQLSFWLPLLEWKPGALMPGLVLAVPYIFVDNPMSYVGGREDYGYPKVLGQFDPPTGLGNTITVNAYGGDFGPNAVAGWVPFMTLTLGKTNVAIEPRAPVNNFDDFVTDISGGRMNRGKPFVVSTADGRTTTVPADQVDAFMDNPTQLFLKQFRDFKAPGTACYQQIVEVPLEVTMGEMKGIGRGPTDITIFPLDSHPIGKELGIASQTGIVPYTLKMEFNVLPGRIPHVETRTAGRFARDD